MLSCNFEEAGGMPAAAGCHAMCGPILLLAVAAATAALNALRGLKGLCITAVIVRPGPLKILLQCLG